MTVMATAIRRASIEHRNEAAIDDLTGALNRRSLAARSEELQQQTAMTGEPVAVLAADIDDFKRVNDLHGHQAGDRVLVALARLLRTRAGVGGQAYRLGGDEFVLLLPGATAMEAGLVAEDILRASRAEPLDGVPLTVSVGVAASVSGTTFSFEDVFAAADAALYEAKHGGRDAVRIAAAPALAA
jgi:diguanylate cyclase (GGDEF)-like protein